MVEIDLIVFITFLSPISIFHLLGYIVPPIVSPTHITVVTVDRYLDDASVMDQVQVMSSPGVSIRSCSVLLE